MPLLLCTLWFYKRFSWLQRDQFIRRCTNYSSASSLSDRRIQSYKQALFSSLKHFLQLAQCESCIGNGVDSPYRLPVLSCWWGCIFMSYSKQVSRDMDHEKILIFIRRSTLLRFQVPARCSQSVCR